MQSQLMAKHQHNKNNIADICNYQDPSKRILFWGNFLCERINLVRQFECFILMSKISSVYGNYPIDFKKIEDKMRSLELW